MSWHCSQALVAAFLEATCLVGALSAPSSSTPMPEAYYWPDKTTEHSRLSRFGMTSEPLMADRGAELLTWFQEGFRAKTSASQAKATALTESDQDSGQKWRGWFAKYDRDSCSWKTAQCSLLEDLDEFSETWPQWGLMRDGACWEQTMSVPRIEESASGFWATPTTMDSLPPKSAEALHREATVARPGRSKPSNLRDQVSNQHMWPTPTVCGNYNKKGASKNAGDGLATAVMNWPTPAARDYRHPNAKSYAERGGGSKGEQLPNAVGGTLNPDWVEWLMGWPIGWTDLKPLATGKCQRWQQQHGEYLPDREAA
jgi:hypothetical protein